MNLDQFAQAYYQMAGAAVYAKPVPVSPEDTALILIDVQDCLTRDYYEAACRAAGMDMEALAPAMEELEQFIGGTLDNIGKVLNACREKGIRPIHVKIESYLPDGADTGPPPRLGGDVLSAQQPHDQVPLSRDSAGRGDRTEEDLLRYLCRNAGGPHPAESGCA